MIVLSYLRFVVFVHCSFCVACCVLFVVRCFLLCYVCLFIVCRFVSGGWCLRFGSWRLLFSDVLCVRCCLVVGVFGVWCSVFLVFVVRCSLFVVRFGMCVV